MKIGSWVGQHPGITHVQDVGNAPRGQTCGGIYQRRHRPADKQSGVDFGLPGAEAAVAPNLLIVQQHSLSHARNHFARGANRCELMGSVVPRRRAAQLDRPVLAQGVDERSRSAVRVD